jgi:hypothetical protein
LFVVKLTVFIHVFDIFLNFCSSCIKHLKCKKKVIFMNSISGSVTTNKLGTLTHTNGKLNVTPSQRHEMTKTTSGRLAYNLAEAQARNDAVHKAAMQNAFKKK